MKYSYTFLDLPAWLLFLIIVGGSVALACSLAVLVSRHHISFVDSKYNELVGFFFTTIGVIYAVILAFLVISVWVKHDAADTAVSEEAAAIVSLARFSSTFPEPVRAEVHDLLRHYTVEVMDTEWRYMREGSGEDFHARDDINNLWFITQKLPNPSMSGVFDSLDNLTRQRALRLLASTGGLPSVFWALLIFGEVLVVYFSLLFQQENPKLGIIMVALLAASMSLCLWFILLFNNPYVGDLQVAPNGLNYALEVIDSLPR